jgi:hypothetical protein
VCVRAALRAREQQTQEPPSIAAAAEQQPLPSIFAQALNFSQLRKRAELNAKCKSKQAA